MKKCYSTTLALIVSVLAMISAPVHATLQSTDIKSQRVVFADLDLTSEQDLQALYKRLQNAARAVCDTQVRPTLRESILIQQCTDQALNEAIAEIGHPGLGNVQ